MTKYRLVKTYPGSPELGTVVEEKCKTSNFYMFNSNAVLRSHVEDNPEYWEEVDDEPVLIYIVVTKKGHNFLKIFTTLGYLYKELEPNDRRLFKTLEEAQEFVFNNIPCLSLDDIKDVLDTHQRTAIELLVKSKI